MRVNFREPLRQISDEPLEPRLGHGAVPGEPEHLIGGGEACPPETRALEARQRRMREG